MYLEFLTQNWFLFAALVAVLAMLGMSYAMPMIYKSAHRRRSGL